MVKMLMMMMMLMMLMMLMMVRCAKSELHLLPLFYVLGCGVPSPTSTCSPVLRLGCGVPSLTSTCPPLWRGSLCASEIIEIIL